LEAVISAGKGVTLVLAMAVVLAMALARAVWRPWEPR
jgi:hypothetical protein